MLEFFGAILALVFARAIWHYVLAQSKRCGQSPLRWLVEVTGLLVAAAILMGSVVAAILYVVVQ